MVQLKVKADEFANHLTDLNNLNNDVRERTEKLLKSIKELCPKPKTTCSVCFCAPPTHVLIECGHGQLCENCATRALSRSRCFTCRQRITGILRVFI